MKRFLITMALLTSPLIVSAAPNVGVSINIGEPGYYGQIVLGDFPPPPVLYTSPVIIQPVPGIAYPPLYLRVPPGQYRNWRRYCGRYNACGRPVYFVRDDWYRNDYAPRYRREHDHGRGHAYGHDKDRWDDRGHGHGHGRGHDRGDDR